jgi:cysteine desulfurase
MGVDPELARGAVRFSLGAGNTMSQVDEFLRALKAVVSRLRSLTAMAV